MDNIGISGLDARTVLLLKKYILDAAHPPNEIYISFDHINPATKFGGTWVRLAGAFLYGVTKDEKIGEVGGSQTHTHSLTDGYAKINHHDGAFWFSEVSRSFSATGKATAGGAVNSSAQTEAIGLGGNTNTADIMPPYIKVSIWRRVS